MTRHSKFKSSKYDFELIFHPHGTVELIDVRKGLRNSWWTSDSDDDFADEFEGDFFEAEDADDILDYLEDRGILDPDSDYEVEVIENDLIDESDDDDDNVIDGEFIERSK